MNNRIKYRIVLDTETCPIDKDFEGVTPSNMWVYDCGWAVVDRNGNVYKTRSFVNADIFLNEKIAMNSAYYQNKIPKYWDEIKSGERVLTSFAKIRKALLEDIAEFKVVEIYAHNMRFDYGTLNTTQRWLTKSKYRYFFPYDIKICDTLKMSRQVIANKKKYIDFCKENNYLTARGTPRLTAEILYRFISGNQDFTEEHTGLADAIVESQILARCFKSHKKIDKKINRQCWRIPQTLTA